MQKELEEQKESVDSLVCPSFSIYSSDKLADIADQVTRDHLRSQNDNDSDANDDHNHRRHENDQKDFEFVAFRKAADEVFFEGYAGPVFPIFNRDLLTPPEKDCDGGERRPVEEEDAAEIQFPMGKLLISDEDRRRDPPSSSSSEVDELDSIPAGTYCVWTPKSVQASPSRCKKSNSTGSSSTSSSSTPSKRWKLLDLLRRSKSDGKDAFVFLTPSNLAKKKKKKDEAKSENSNSSIEKNVSRITNESSGGRVAGKKVAGGGGGEKKVPVTVSAHEALYVRNREMRRVDNRKSYLPYKQDLVGFCASLNGMGRAFPPF